ncbi:MAG: hypothetical protein HY560_08525, partial [Gemmatimonadetes bacterium]|nr:hypothetical protein [Gemmatimonadota bacterium]
SGQVMRPVFDAARREPRRVVYAEGEDERVLRAVQVAVDDGLAKPIIIGRRRVVTKRIETLGLRIVPGKNVELCGPDDDPRFREYWQLYHSLMERKGVTPGNARAVVRSDTTVIACLMLHRGEADPDARGHDVERRQVRARRARRAPRQTIVGEEAGVSAHHRSVDPRGRLRRRRSRRSRGRARRREHGAGEE